MAIGYPLAARASSHNLVSIFLLLNLNARFARCVNSSLLYLKYVLHQLQELLLLSGLEGRFFCHTLQISGVAMQFLCLDECKYPFSYFATWQVLFKSWHFGSIPFRFPLPNNMVGHARPTCTLVHGCTGDIALQCVIQWSKELR